MLLDLLKEETGPHHRAIESLMPMPLNIEAYRQRLQCLLGYLEPWERLVFAALHDHPNLWAGRAKAQWLKDDLRNLGLSMREVHSLPRCCDLPVLSSVPLALGSLYVWEGSTLGGQVISRYLRDTLSVEPETGGRYFCGYGMEAGHFWRTFSKMLLTFSSPTDDKSIVYGAVQTFTSLHRWTASLL